LNKSVSIGKGTIKLDARGRLFNPNNPTAIMCIRTKENIMELWTIGQNSPPVSYFGEYTLKSCMDIKHD